MPYRAVVPVLLVGAHGDLPGGGLRLAGLAGLIRAILPGCREAKVPGRGGSAQCERAQFRGSGLGPLLQVPDLWCCPICYGSRPVAFRESVGFLAQLAEKAG